MLTFKLPWKHHTKVYFIVTTTEKQTNFHHLFVFLIIILIISLIKDKGQTMCRIFICIRYKFKLYRLRAFRFEVNLAYNYKVLFSPEYPIIVSWFLSFLFKFIYTDTEH